jgi:hypothetical protein
MFCSDVQCCYNSASLHNMRQTMGTISNHWSCYNNIVHRYTTCDKTWEQSVTTGAIITTLCIPTRFVVCCVVMHSVVITALVVTDCSHGMSYVV